jgi:hypothetical protein
MNGKNNLCRAEMKKIYITGLGFNSDNRSFGTDIYIIERRNSWNAGQIQQDQMDSISASMPN